MNYNQLLCKIKTRLPFLFKPKYNEKELNQLVKNKFEELGLDYIQAKEFLNSYLNKQCKPAYNPQIDSIHQLLLVALSLKIGAKGNIFEFGTYLGETTALCSELFKQGKVYTIDLPKDDPILRTSYSRENDKSFNTYSQVQENNMRKTNIISIKANTLFLPKYSNEIHQSFDLIWLDAGHNYPEIAWDFAFSLNLLKTDNAYLLIDDVIPIEKDYKTQYVSNHSWKLINYLKERSQVDVTLVLKREDPSKFDCLTTRKYVAVIKF